MLTVLLVILLVCMLFGGDWYTYGHRTDGGWYAPGIGTLLVVLVLLWLLFGGGLH